MTLLKKSDRFTVTGISMAGGVCHNIGQLAAAIIIVETYQVGYYLPVLLIAGLITRRRNRRRGREVLKRIRNLSFQ